MIAFGSDGMLYIAVGDGGGGGDPDNLAQDTTNLLGTLLRIEPSVSPSPVEPYTVPVDNPLQGSGTRICGLDGYQGSDTCREIFGYGLRNPWRFSVDRSTGDVWIGDVGQGRREEVDYIAAGVRDAQNFGWRIFEGTDEYNNPDDLPLSDFVAPIHEYAHDSQGGRSITGGYVYRGSDMPTFYGRYIYGDYGSGRIWALSFDGSSVTANEEVASLSSISSFGEDRDGELYVLSIGSGAVYRFRERIDTGDDGVPQRLSDTGLFTDLPNLTATPGMIEYDVIAPLWSDDATKRRWIALPGTQQITFRANDTWSFPVGTALVKHFELRLASGETRTSRDTRLLPPHPGLARLQLSLELSTDRRRSAAGRGDRDAHRGGSRRAGR